MTSKKELRPTVKTKHGSQKKASEQLLKPLTSSSKSGENSAKYDEKLAIKIL